MKTFNSYLFLFIILFSALTAAAAECPTQSRQVPGHSGIAKCYVIYGGYQTLLQANIYDPILSSSVMLFHNNGMGVSVGGGNGLSCIAQVPPGGTVTVHEKVCPPPTALGISSQSLGMYASEQSIVNVSTNERLEPIQTLSISGADEYNRQIEYKVVNTGGGSNRNWTLLATLLPFNYYTSTQYRSLITNLGLIGRNTYTTNAPGLTVFFRARSIDEKGKKSAWRYSRGIWLYTDRLASSGSHGYYLAPYCAWITPQTQPGQTVLVSNLLCPVNNGVTYATKLDRAPWSPGTNCIFYGGVAGSTCVNYIVE